MYKVKLNSRLTAVEVIFLLILVLLFGFFLYKIGLGMFNYLLFFIVFATCILEFIGDKSISVSEIIVTPAYLNIVFCCRGQIVDVMRIKREQIAAISVNAYVSASVNKIMSMSGKVVITQSNGNVCFPIVSRYSDMRLSHIFNSTIQPLINLAKMQNKFKFANFSYDISGPGCEYARLTVERYLTKGKRNFLNEMKDIFNSSSMGGFSVVVLILVLAVVILGILSLPIAIFWQKNF